ncbi:hypothetical protein [Futiania mangrovi]|uniref:Uncharacterized protein n=1 Tax=Futiania mangrovi TaxID=2959716 RepID=A0A9J6PIQ6_9PROT|nr:hypothetical protein [Futiania mangrovii]MCP1335962.1 hypothetical protein [Futiania mangrovii]
MYDLHSTQPVFVPIQADDLPGAFSLDPDAAGTGGATSAGGGLQIASSGTAAGAGLIAANTSPPFVDQDIAFPPALNPSVDAIFGAGYTAGLPGGTAGLSYGDYFQQWKPSTDFGTAGLNQATGQAAAFVNLDAMPQLAQITGLSVQQATDLAASNEVAAKLVYGDPNLPNDDVTVEVIAEAVTWHAGNTQFDGRYTPVGLNNIIIGAFSPNANAGYREFAEIAIPALGQYALDNGLGVGTVEERGQDFLQLLAGAAVMPNGQYNSSNMTWDNLTSYVENLQGVDDGEAFVRGMGQALGAAFAQAAQQRIGN